MIKIIDYRAGNAPSVLSAVEHLGYKADLVNKPAELEGASHIILPGVGAAKATLESLNSMNIIDSIYDAVFNRKVMFLGICVGMQILFEYSMEGDTKCLKWFGGTVKKFDSKNVNVPQMGWNKVSFTEPRYDGYYYFVNSYYVKAEDESIIWGTCEYDGEFTAAIKKDNIFATQFHIEKSGGVGLALLKSFLDKK